MSSIDVISNAMAATIVNAVGPIAVMPNIDSISGALLPAIMITPAPVDTADFTGAFGRGTDVWEFYIYVLVAGTITGLAQQALNQYLSGAGDLSIRQALFNDSGIGLEDTQVVCTGVRGYGGKFKNVNIPMVGAILCVRAITDGTS